MKIFGGALILVGLALGIYVGGYLCFYCGIVGIINQIIIGVRTGGVVSTELALNIVKVIFAGVLGSLAALFPVAIGSALIE